MNCTPKVGHRSNLWGVFHDELDTDPTFGVFFMTKYDEQFKLSVVQSYAQGTKVDLPPYYRTQNHPWVDKS